MNVYHISCPNCQQALNINEQQLSIKNGFVRCSHCQTIFSAAEQLQVNHLSTATHKAQDTLSQSKISATDGMLFDDELGLDEAGNPIITKAAAPTSPYAISKPYITSANKKSSAVSDNFDILDKFDILEKFEQLSKPNVTQSNKLSAETIALAHDKNTPMDENVWLESLMAQANANEEAQANGTNNPKLKDYSHSAVNADMLDQIAINTTDDEPSDLTAYQKKIDQRLSQQVSSQRAISSTSSPMNLVWGLASLLLLLSLIAQYIVFNINTLVTSKQTAARLTSLCQSLSSTCRLPIADTGLIAVDTLKLASATKQARQTDVIFTLTNTTSNHIVYPNLKVSLRTGNTIKTQTVLTPVNYVQAGNNYLMPNQIKVIKLRIDYPKAQVQQVNIVPFY